MTTNIDLQLLDRCMKNSPNTVWYLMALRSFKVQFNRVSSTLSNTSLETKATRYINMFRLTARNIVPRRIAVTQYRAGPVQMRGMADKRVEQAAQAAGEAKNSIPEVRSWSTVQERLTCAENKLHAEPLGRLICRCNR